MRLLAGRQIIVFPDTDTHDHWVEKAKEIEKALDTPITVSDFILDDTIANDKQNGYDLADLFSKSIINPPQLITEVQKVLQRMIKKNPHLQTLIDKLDLDTDNATLTRNDSN